MITRNISREKLNEIITDVLSVPQWVFNEVMGINSYDISKGDFPKFFYMLLEQFINDRALFYSYVDSDCSELIDTKINNLGGGSLSDKELEHLANRIDMNMYIELAKRRNIDISLADIVRKRLKEETNENAKGSTIK